MSTEGAITQQEMVQIAAGIIGLDQSTIVGALLIAALDDGQVAVSGTGTCDCFPMQMIGRAIERISDNMHKGEL
jgi:hypothetical protein